MKVRALTAVAITLSATMACGPAVSSSAGPAARSPLVSSTAERSSAVASASDPAAPIAEEAAPAPRAELADGPDQLVVGQSVACLRLAEGRVACWGDLAPIAGASVATTATILPELTGVVDLTLLSSANVCALREDRSIECRAARDASRSTLHGLRDVVELGQGCVRLGDGRVICESPGGARTVVALRGASAVLLMSEHACGIVSGRVLCAAHEGAAVRELPIEGTVVEIHGSRDLLFARTEDGLVRAAGVHYAAPALEIDVPRDARAVRGWDAALCAIERDGHVACRVHDDSGDVRRVEGVERAVEVVVRSDQACALGADGTVSCWIFEDEQGSGRRAFRASRIVGVQDAIELDIADDRACVRRQDGQVLCWPIDRGSSVQTPFLRYDGTPRAATASVIEDLEAVVELAAGTAHTCARRADGRVLCWGDGRGAQLGIDTEQRSSPMLVPGVEDVAQIAAEGSMTCARASEGRVRCWGTPFLGAPSMPTEVAFEGTARDLAILPQSVCALIGDTVHCADGLDESARPLPEGRNIVDIVSGSGLLSLDRAGALFGWDFPSRYDGGRPRAHRLADGVTRVLSRSTAVGSDGGGIAIQGPDPSWTASALRGPAPRAASDVGWEGCSIDAAGGVHCWSGRRDQEHAIDGVSDAIAIASGAGFACAARSDGRVLCWGTTAWGVLGNGVTSTATGPTFIHGLP